MLRRVRSLVMVFVVVLAACSTPDDTALSDPAVEPTTTMSASTPEDIDEAAAATPDLDAAPSPATAAPAATPTPTSTSAPATETPAAVTATPLPSATPQFELDLDVTPARFPVLRTTTGVPVSVLGETPDGYLVRTPCGNVAEVGGGTPVDDITVVLDPGHGGAVDTGAVGPNGLVERDLNLRLAFATEALLVDRGITVELTRRADYLVPLFVRAALADDLEAELMVSIHHNAPIANPSDQPGTEVFVQSGSPDSERLGGLLYEEVLAALSEFDIAWTTAPDAGVLRVLLPSGTDAYGMIRRPATPTALVELGYLANPPEAELFATEEYIVVAAIALADAVEAYLTTDRPGTGFGNPDRVFTPNFAPGADVCVETPLG